MTRFHSFATSVTVLCGLGALDACAVTSTRPNPDHCSNNEGDQYCAENFPDRPFCISGVGVCTEGGRTGCLAEVSDECHYPCGMLSDDECDVASASSSGSDGSSGEMTTTGEESSGSGSESTTTGPMPCEGNDECTDAAAPFCDPAVGECVSCDQLMDGNGDGACADVDPMAPLCVGAACVACTEDNTVVCDGQLLVCDDASNTCGACTEHGQCDSGACDVDNGTCFDPANVFDVGMGQTYGTITAALGEVGTMALDNAVLRLHEGMSFDEVATVDAGAVAFVAADGQSPQWSNLSALAPTLTVNGDGTRVYMVGVRLSQNGNDIGLLVDGATVDVRRSRIVQNSGGGIVAQGGAELYVENSFVGVSATDVTPLLIDDSDASVIYSTVIGNIQFASVAAIGCTSPGEVTIRNSIVTTQGGDVSEELDCEGAVVSYTATEGEVDGESNVAVGNFPDGVAGQWFANFTAGDYSLQNDGVTTFANIAQWQGDDPPTDINGDARPATDGAADYAGADVP